MCSSPKSNRSAIQPDYKNYSLMAELSSAQRQRFTYVANNAAARRERLDEGKRQVNGRKTTLWQFLTNVLNWLRHPTITMH